MTCSPWGFSRQEYWSGLPCPPPGDVPNPGIKPGLPHCRWILYLLQHHGSPRILEWVAYPFFAGSSQHRDYTGVSHIAVNSLRAEPPGKAPGPRLQHETQPPIPDFSGQHLCAHLHPQTPTGFLNPPHHLPSSSFVCLLPSSMPDGLTLFLRSHTQEKLCS